MELEKNVYTKSSNELVLRLETSRNLSDYEKYEKLRYDIWKDPNDYLASNRNLFSENIFTRGSSIFIGAFIKERIVGFSYGYFGVDWMKGFDDISNIHFYSQYNGVLKENRNDGIGYAIKEYQKEVVKSIGINKILSTFDPLTSVNAFINLHKLRSTIISYEENPYHKFGGKLNNPKIPSDRLLNIWMFDNERQIKEYDLTNCKKLFLNSTSFDDRGIERIEKLNYIDDETVFIKIPLDYYDILEIDHRLALDWRMKTRELFKEYIDNRKYRIVDFNISGIDAYYILTSSVATL